MKEVPQEELQQKFDAPTKEEFRVEIEDDEGEYFE